MNVLIQDFLNSVVTSNEKERTVSLLFGEEKHALSLKVFRVTFKYRQVDYHFEKETSADGSFDSAVWYCNGGTYCYVDKRTGKKTEMLKIRSLFLFLLEEFHLSIRDSKEFSIILSSFLDTQMGA